MPLSDGMPSDIPNPLFLLFFVYHLSLFAVYLFDYGSLFFIGFDARRIDSVLSFSCMIVL